MSHKIMFSLADGIDQLSNIPIQIEHLQTLRDKMCEANPTLYMSVYIKEFDQQTLCATSCCLAGWGMEWKIGTTPAMDAMWYAQKLNKAGTSAAYEYGLFLVGLPNDTTVPDKVIDDYFIWLFGGNWPNLIQHALERIDYFIQHKSAPVFIVAESHSRRTSYTDISLLDLMKQLPKSKYLEHAYSSDYEDIGCPYIMVDLDCRCAVTDKVGVFTCELIEYDPNPRHCEGAILVHEDDIDTFNQLTTAFKVVER